AAGVQKSMDFLLRNNQMRPTALFVVASGTAADILTVESEAEALPAMNISKTIKSYGEASQFKAVTIADFADRLMSKTTAPIAPLLSTVMNGNTKIMYVSGLAVFKKDKMIGTLNQTETRGLLWVTGEVKKGLILINAPDGTGKAVLKISSATSKVTPQVEDGKLTMHIKILAEGTLAEQTSTENLATVPAIAWLQERQAEAIRQEIIAAFAKSRELQADIFGFGDMVHQKLPVQWAGLAESWDEVYAAGELIIDVETKINGTNVLTNPATPEKQVTNERLANEY
ncbi:MAG TPA: Ger(x)C family spore germination protein, partial [Negativicutes bacterium]